MCPWNHILQWNFFLEIFGYFWPRKLTLKVRILPFLTTFAQLSTRLKNFLRGWLLVLGLKEGLVECATVCVKSAVILGMVSLSCWCHALVLPTSKAETYGSQIRNLSFENNSAIERHKTSLVFRLGPEGLSFWSNWSK